MTVMTTGHQRLAKRFDGWEFAFSAVLLAPLALSLGIFLIVCFEAAFNTGAGSFSARLTHTPAEYSPGTWRSDDGRYFITLGADGRGESNLLEGLQPAGSYAPHSRISYEVRPASSGLEEGHVIVTFLRDSDGEPAFLVASTDMWTGDIDWHVIYFSRTDPDLIDVYLYRVDDGERG